MSSMVDNKSKNKKPIKKPGKKTTTTKISRKPAKKQIKKTNRRVATKKPVAKIPLTVDQPTIIIFTDGSCTRNGKANSHGGMGIHFPNGELKDISKIYDLEKPCTNQNTELYAILLALKYVRKNLNIGEYRIWIKTDSEYSINCVTKWIKNWIRNGWMNQKGEPVVNKELIEAIYQYYEKYNIIFQHVEGHSKKNNADAIGNNRADYLATRASEKSATMIKNNSNMSVHSRGENHNPGRSSIIIELLKSKPKN